LPFKNARRNFAVCERLALRIAAGRPMATTAPPAAPPSGPRSMIQSASFYATHPDEATMKRSSAAPEGATASQLISNRIAALGDWRGETLARIRALLRAADPDIVEEWKWMGTPVWSHDGIVCTGVAVQPCASAWLWCPARRRRSTHRAALAACRAVVPCDAGVMSAGHLTIAVAGASGFVGRPLIAALARRGAVIALSRAARPAADGVEWRRADLFSYRDALAALAGADHAVYLVHSMSPSDRLVQGRFEDLDLQAADNFARAAAVHGVRQIVYLGGLLPADTPPAGLSRHLRSRAEVERALADYGTPLTAWCGACR
jgi:hypothetical protein